MFVDTNKDLLTSRLVHRQGWYLRLLSQSRIEPIASSLCYCRLCIASSFCCCCCSILLIRQALPSVLLEKRRRREQRVLVQGEKSMTAGRGASEHQTTRSKDDASKRRSTTSALLCRQKNGASVSPNYDVVWRERITNPGTNNVSLQFKIF